MSNLFNRIAMAWTCLSHPAIMMIVASKPREDNPEIRTKITLWGTIDDKQTQVMVLNQLSASIQKDIDDHTTQLQGTEAGDRIISS